MRESTTKDVLLVCRDVCGWLGQGFFRGWMDRVNRAQISTLIPGMPPGVPVTEAPLWWGRWSHGDCTSLLVVAAVGQSDPPVGARCRQQWSLALASCLDSAAPCPS